MDPLDLPIAIIQGGLRGVGWRDRVGPQAPENISGLWDNSGLRRNRNNLGLWDGTGNYGGDLSPGLGSRTALVLDSRVAVALVSGPPLASAGTAVTSGFEAPPVWQAHSGVNHPIAGGGVDSPRTGGAANSACDGRRRRLSWDGRRCRLRWS